MFSNIALAQTIDDRIINLKTAALPFWEQYGGLIQSFAAVLIAVLLFGIVYLIMRINFIDYQVEKYMDILAVGDLSRRRSVRAWQQIKKRMERGGEANYKLAVIEADKILDELLKLGGYKGETMADRLKQITPAQLSNIERLWQAHRLRNRLVHEPDYPLNSEEAEIAINLYKKAFQEMGLID